MSTLSPIRFRTEPNLLISITFNHKFYIKSLSKFILNTQEIFLPVTGNRFDLEHDRLVSTWGVLNQVRCHKVPVLMWELRSTGRLSHYPTSFFSPRKFSMSIFFVVLCSESCVLNILLFVLESEMFVSQY